MRTELDARYSEAGTSATTWQQACEVLSDAQISWLTTVRADGRPHVTPLVAVWLDETLYFSTGGSEQKGINLRGNPHVVVTTGCNEWSSGLDVMVEGEAVRVTDDALLRRLAEAWRDKWDGQWQFEVRDHAFAHDRGEQGIALVYAVAPRQVLAFGRMPFTHTRHEF